jgi:hypothetical protein
MMFEMRLSHSARALNVKFAIHAQEAFLEGYVLAFEHFGAVPGRACYDNLKPCQPGADAVIIFRRGDPPVSSTASFPTGSSVSAADWVLLGGSSNRPQLTVCPAPGARSSLTP